MEEGNLKKLIEERLMLREAKDKGIISTDEEVEELLDEISKERGISRDHIYRILYENKRAELLNNWLRGLWGKASIIIRD